MLWLSVCFTHLCKHDGRRALLSMTLYIHQTLIDSITFISMLLLTLNLPGYIYDLWLEGRTLSIGIYFHSVIHLLSDHSTEYCANVHLLCTSKYSDLFLMYSFSSFIHRFCDKFISTLIVFIVSVVCNDCGHYYSIVDSLKSPAYVTYTTAYFSLLYLSSKLYSLPD